MKNFIKIICIVFLLSGSEPIFAMPSFLHALPNDSFWIKNNWKSTNGYLKNAPVNWRSLESIHLLVSGSANPTIGNLVWLKKQYGTNRAIYLLDLRQETHFYVNGLPVSLFYKRDEINWGKSKNTIMLEEQQWVKEWISKGSILLNQLGKPQKGFKVPIKADVIRIKELTTEQEAAQRASINYLRITARDYLPPSPEEVDQFIAIINQLPNNSWLHIHCAAGKGRTTTFMVMRDIMAHGDKLSLDAIISRNADLGGSNLSKPSLSHRSQPWKRQYHLARVQLLHLFYEYIHSKANAKQTFKGWIQQKPLNVKNYYPLDA